MQPKRLHVKRNVRLRRQNGGPGWSSMPILTRLAALVARRTANCSLEKNNAGPKPALSQSNLQNDRSARSARTGASAARTALTRGTRAEHRLRLHRQQAFTLQLLARQLARTADGFGLFAGLLLGRLFIMTAELHLPENALA